MWFFISEITYLGKEHTSSLRRVSKLLVLVSFSLCNCISKWGKFSNPIFHGLLGGHFACAFE